MISEDVLERVLRLAILTDGIDKVMKFLAHSLVVLCRVRGDKKLTVTFNFGEQVTIEPNDDEGERQ